MKLPKRLGAAVLTAATTLALTAAPALAAPPGNDLYPGRTVVGAVPFTDQVDTTQATTDADDQEVNTTCGAPALDASVWYELTAATDDVLLADVSGSSYSAGVAVVTGAPGSFSLVACGPGATAWQASAGTKYTLLAFDDQFDGGGNGGVLNLKVEVAPPPPALEVTVSPTATFNSRTGAVTLTGTINCEDTAQFAFVDAQLTQRVGRMLIRGFGGTDVTCDGTTRPWSFMVQGDNGLFKGGKAAQVTFSLACGVAFCSEYLAEQTIQIKGGK